MRIATILLLAFVVFTSEKCKEQGETGAYKYPEDSRIEMSKTPCFGKCPVYKIGITANGNAEFEGIRFVEKEGDFVKKFSPEVTNELFETFIEADFWSYQDEYYDEQVTDLPTTYLTFKHEGKEKKIRMYVGFPDALRDLAGKVEALANSEGWIPKE